MRARDYNSSIFMTILVWLFNRVNMSVYLLSSILDHMDKTLKGIPHHKLCMSVSLYHPEV